MPLRIKGNLRGVTLIELLMATVIMSIVFMMTRYGSDLINRFAIERSAITSQQQAELAMYMIKNDINNARSIIHVSSDTLQLLTFDFSAGYDSATSPNLFSQTFLSTITYRYTVTEKKQFLQRTIQRPATGTLKSSFAENILLAPSISNYIFTPGPKGGSTSPYPAVQICLRLNLPFSKGTIKKLEQEILKRGLTN